MVAQWHFASPNCSLRGPEGMPSMVLKAQQWQLCDSCGRKPLELVEIAACLPLWYSCMPTRPRVRTRMLPAQECWVREGGIFNHLANLDIFLSLLLQWIHHFLKSIITRVCFYHRSRHARLTTEQELDREEVAVGLKL